jgi:hypothetical protein
MSSTSKPVHEIRLGQIRAAVWANETQGRQWFNVSITRSFQDQGKWKEWPSYARDDLPIVSMVADMAYAWIWSQGSTED